MKKYILILSAMLLMPGMFISRQNLIKVNNLEQDFIARGAIYKKFSRLTNNSLYESRYDVPETAFFTVNDSLYNWTGFLDLEEIGTRILNNRTYYYGYYSGTLASSGL